MKKNGRCFAVTNKRPDCIGHYDFERIVQYAKMRFVEGCSTINLLQQARSDTEREEVALVCLLDVEDELVVNIELNCRHAGTCKVADCRQRLRSLIETKLILE